MKFCLLFLGLIAVCAIWCSAGFMMASDIHSAKLAACEAQIVSLAEQDIMEALGGL